MSCEALPVSSSPYYLLLGLQEHALGFQGLKLKCPYCTISTPLTEPSLQLEQWHFKTPGMYPRGCHPLLHSDKQNHLALTSVSSATCVSECKFPYLGDDNSSQGLRKMCMID